MKLFIDTSIFVDVLEKTLKLLSIVNFGRIENIRATTPEELGF